MKVLAAYPGPVITRYEIEPAVGVKGAQIVNLIKDLGARVVGACRSGVVETIPGKVVHGARAAEPAPADREAGRDPGVDDVQRRAGRADAGARQGHRRQAGRSADLARMPHLLVAGTTGSGKSVAVNAMILSLLYKAEPQQVRLDPDRSEDARAVGLRGIPHLLAPVVTDMKLAPNALNWCVGEMERRYKLMSTARRAQPRRLQRRRSSRRGRRPSR